MISSGAGELLIIIISFIMLLLFKNDMLFLVRSAALHNVGITTDIVDSSDVWQWKVLLYSRHDILFIIS